MGFSPQKPQRRAIERNEKAIQRWVEETWPTAKKLEEIGGEFVFIDESGLLVTNIATEHVMDFSKDLFPHLERPVLWLWDGLGAHRSKCAREPILSRPYTEILPLPG